MKLRCDLKIQNLNSQITTNQEKLHKAATIGLYRPRPDADSTRSTDLADGEIILTIEAKSINVKYKLKKIETYTKFINEGKATLKLIDLNLYLLISNTPSLTLINFVSFLNVKITKSLKSNPNLQDKENRNTTFAKRLLDKADCNYVAGNQLKVISPLTETDVNTLLKRKQAKQSTESPTTFKTRPVSNLVRHSSSSSNLLVQLTDEQKYVIKLAKERKNLFFTGSGGTGKSFLINVLKKCFQNDACFVTASTGVAASLIGGITLHAFAGFTVESAPNGDDLDAKNRKILDKIVNSREKLNNWKKCQQLIIDEVSMIDGQFFDTLDFVARSIRNNDEPFGGIQIILSGDFFQLPPVSKYGEEKKKFCFQSVAWKDADIHSIQLTQIKRQQDKKFIELLEEIRYGRCSQKTVDLLEKSKETAFDCKEILPTKLCTHKDDVDFINKRELDSLNTTKQTFNAQDEGDSMSLKKVLNILCPARDELTLAQNAQVMLIKNLDVSAGLVNGARGYVTGFTENKMPIVKFMNGAELTVKYETWSFKINSFGLMLTRKQLPLQLAWAMSIHKSQGMTLDCVEISLSRVFEFGQAYVALSRAKSLSSVRIIDFDVNAIRANEVVIKFYERLNYSKQNKLNFD